jgi:hypothetical protein
MNVTDLHIGVDAFSVIYLFKEEREAFEAYMRGLLMCAGKQGSLTFVMDRRASKEKMEVVRERREQRNSAKAEANNLASFAKSEEFEQLDSAAKHVIENLIAEKEQAAWHLYPAYLKWLEGMLSSLSVTMTWAEEEADEYLASLTNHDVIVSSDSDMLVLGVKCLWIPKGVALHHNEIVGAEFLNYVGLEKNKLFALAFLAGCDVQPKSLMPVNEAVSRLRFYGSIEQIHARHPAIVTDAHMAEYNRLSASKNL